MDTLTYFYFSGEQTNGYYFVRTKLNWEALDEAPYAAFYCVTSLIGMWIEVVNYRVAFICVLLREGE